MSDGFIVTRRDALTLEATPPQAAGATDIAFAASAVEVDGETLLYYSVADKDMFRAALRRAWALSRKGIFHGRRDHPTS